jgi:REP element-mobilizing transposase RayT
MLRNICESKQIRILKPNIDPHLHCLVHHFPKKIKLLACMNFVVKIIEISF